ncbi:hypothetical protein IEO70_02760 [Bacillus sp. AGMB 02131]|uniref:Uncharacterized protein n=1 Tax=Peribacillus faecalis TaxID=2772559 RepID=A0A927HBC9_9BACI|nr:hypothetical protein [Peribacillus faecalis]MBD3107273.1 hypothetical protein [Peribacillus faecalis]
MKGLAIFKKQFFIVTCGLLVLGLVQSAIARHQLLPTTEKEQSMVTTMDIPKVMVSTKVFLSKGN